MNNALVSKFKGHFSHVEEKTLDARIFDNNMAFQGYDPAFVQWVEMVATEICSSTPDSHASFAAEGALEDIRSGLEARYDSGIRNLRNALTEAIEYHSNLHVKFLQEFMSMCDTIGSNPEFMLSEFCQRFCAVASEGGRHGSSVTISITTLNR